MPAPNHLLPLSSEERRRRLATLLATGLLRLGTALVQPTSPSQPASENVSESRPNQLAVSGEKSVTVSAG